MFVVRIPSFLVRSMFDAKSGSMSLTLQLPAFFGRLGYAGNSIAAALRLLFWWVRSFDRMKTTVKTSGVACGKLTLAAYRSLWSSKGTLRLIGSIPFSS